MKNPRQSNISFSGIQSYIQLFRWHQPIGIWLLLWPVLIALIVAGHGQFTFEHLALFFLGAVASRSAGCVINDYLDRDIDSKVERTRNRPITNNILHKKSVYIAFLSLLLLCAIVSLLISIEVFFIGIIAAIGLSLYPLAKRVYPHPQIILGIVYSLGIPMAWITGSGSLDDTDWILFYLANTCWIYAYDTIYALADKPYDTKLHIHSSALSLGRFDWLGIACAHVLTLILLLIWSRQQALGVFVYIAIAVVGCGFVWQHWYIRIQTIERCIRAFRSNHGLQLFLLLIIILSYRW